MAESTIPTYVGKFPISILNPVLLPSMDDKNESEAGKSCHHCRAHKKGDFLVLCQHIHNNGKKCRKKYCHCCLRKIYNQAVFAVNNDKVILRVEPALENFFIKSEYIYRVSSGQFPDFFNNYESQVPSLLKYSASENELRNSMRLESWECPACLNSCQCTVCKNLQNKALKSGKSLPSATDSPSLTSPSLSSVSSFSASYTKSPLLAATQQTQFSGFPNPVMQNSGYTMSAPQAVQGFTYNPLLNTQTQYQYTPNQNIFNPTVLSVHSQIPAVSHQTPSQPTYVRPSILTSQLQINSNPPQSQNANLLTPTSHSNSHTNSHASSHASNDEKNAAWNFGVKSPLLIVKKNSLKSTPRNSFNAGRDSAIKNEFGLPKRNSMQLDDPMGLNRHSLNIDAGTPTYLNDYNQNSLMCLSNNTPNSSNRRMSDPPSPFFSLTPNQGSTGMRSSIPSPMMNSMDSTNYSSLSSFIIHRNSTFGMGYGRNSLSLSNPRSSISASGTHTSFSLNPHNRDSFSAINAIFSAFPNTPPGASSDKSKNIKLPSFIQS